MKARGSHPALYSDEPLHEVLFRGSTSKTVSDGRSDELVKLLGWIRLHCVLDKAESNVRCRRDIGVDNSRGSDT